MRYIDQADYTSVFECTLNMFLTDLLIDEMTRRPTVRNVRAEPVDDSTTVKEEQCNSDFCRVEPDYIHPPHTQVIQSVITTHLRAAAGLLRLLRKRRCIMLLPTRMSIEKLSMSI